MKEYLDMAAARWSKRTKSATEGEHEQAAAAERMDEDKEKAPNQSSSRSTECLKGRGKPRLNTQRTSSGSTGVDCRSDE